MLLVFYTANSAFTIETLASGGILGGHNFCGEREDKALNCWHRS